MALVLNEEQVMLKESAAGFLAEKATVAHLRRLRDGASAQGFDGDVWREMAAMGWAGIAIPEEFGGLGYGYTGLGLLLEQAGRNLSASPLQSTVLVAATLIDQLGSNQQKERLLAGHCRRREADHPGAAGGGSPCTASRFPPAPGAMVTPGSSMAAS